ncbi:MAG: hypothetical protein KDC42_11310 [Ignavibacteriae bacterium]|nr:hypothetical protein [Ignavibacteriota bacterium]
MKYLENLIKRLIELQNGVKKNMDQWNGLPNGIEDHIGELKKMDDEIEDIRKLLSAKLREARKLRDEKKDEITKLEKRAIGIHADDESKLKDYNIIVK